MERKESSVFTPAAFVAKTNLVFNRFKNNNPLSLPVSPQ